MIMELHGVAAYLDCVGAIIATDGRILADAAEVAEKLGIRVLDMGGAWVELPDPRELTDPRTPRTPDAGLDFLTIWEQYVMPLEGRTLTRPDGSSNDILSVDWSGVERRTSTGNRGKIKIEIFKYAVNRILETGSVTRQQINENYVGRASSGVVLILAQVPIFELDESPLTLRLRVDGHTAWAQTHGDGRSS